ncbi:MAG: hypothetical protein GX132_04210, partial [Erysipelotrichia bacterium]|nr:hypothetical protein [Erysipelotrichia bacterium]
MTHNIKFVKNNLGNIQVFNIDGTNIEGFVKHIELFIDGVDIIYLNINEDEFNKTNNVFFHIKHRKTKNILITINQLE